MTDLTAQEYRDGKQRNRIADALGAASAAAKKPVLIPWAPTDHQHPKKTAKPADQARGMKPARDQRGRFA